MAVDPRDAELYGEELISDVQRWAAPVVDQRVGRLQHEVGELRTTIAQQQTVANQERVERALDNDPQLGGQWRRINNDEAFLHWLDELDPLSSEKRLDLLRRGYRLGDATRVKAFFTAFLARRMPAHARTNHRMPFESSAPQPSVTVRDASDPRKVWTRPEIVRFYEDVRRGRYAGRDAERNKIEAEIIRAGAERRVAGAPPALYGEGQK